MIEGLLKRLVDTLNNKITVIQDAKDRTVTNAVAANLKAEVTQVSSARTVTGTVTANAGTNLNTSSLLTGSDFNTRLGEVLADPAVNTVLARLKTIATNQLADGHNVTVDNASIPVTGTFWQGTQPVSGTVVAKQGVLDYTPVCNFEHKLSSDSPFTIWTPAGGKKFVITDIVICTGATNTFSLKDDTTKIFQVKMVTSEPLHISLKTPYVSTVADNTLIVTFEAIGSGFVDITILGYEE